MAKAYMITYDLNNPGQRYTEIIKVIKEQLSNGVWCSYWKSSFLIKSDKNPTQMLDLLKPHLDNDDRFFIVEVVNNKQGWLEKDEWDYINRNIL